MKGNCISIVSGDYNNCFEAISHGSNDYKYCFKAGRKDCRKNYWSLDYVGFSFTPTCREADSALQNLILPGEKQQLVFGISIGAWFSTNIQINKFKTSALVSGLETLLIC